MQSNIHFHVCLTFSIHNTTNVENIMNFIKIYVFFAHDCTWFSFFFLHILGQMVLRVKLLFKTLLHTLFQLFFSSFLSLPIFFLIYTVKLFNCISNRSMFVFQIKTLHENVPSTDWVIKIRLKICLLLFAPHLTANSFVTPRPMFRKGFYGKTTHLLRGTGPIHSSICSLGNVH